MTKHPINPRTLMRWVIVGHGRVGQSLNLLAHSVGANVAATWNRSKESAQASEVASPDPTWGALPDALGDRLEAPCLLWLTVIDEAIEPVFDALAPAIAPGSVVVHTSGSVSSDVLGDDPKLPCASLHPLQAISDPTAAAQRFCRTFWTIEGDDAAVDALSALLAPEGIEPIRIAPHNKTLYHASAVTAANLLVSLLDSAIAIAEGAEIDATTAQRMLVELASSSLDNLATQTPKEALTGPAARGDHEVIEAHRQALSRLDDPSLLNIYDVLTQRAIDKLTTRD